MRTTMKAFLSCLVLAGVMLAAGGAVAEESCTAGGYTVTTAGPIVNGNSTSITYHVEGSGNVDHAATVVASGETNCATTSITAVTGTSPSTGNQAYAPAVGDPVTGLGRWACHEEAAKINPNGNVFDFTVTVSGARAAAPKTVALKKGSKISACEIVGIGDPAAPVEIAPVIESYTHGGCTLHVTMNKKTGEVLSAVVDPPPPACQFYVDDFDITINGTPHGKPNFGKGYFESGIGSCTTYVWGGRAYSFGDPCP